MDIQGRLYWRIIKRVLEDYEEFNGYTLEDYQFVVVNKTTLHPLVWNFKNTTAWGELRYGSKNQIVLEDPFKLGKELKFYLERNPSTPIGIDSSYHGNDLDVWLNKLDT